MRKTTLMILLISLLYNCSKEADKCENINNCAEYYICNEGVCEEGIIALTNKVVLITQQDVNEFGAIGHVNFDGSLYIGAPNFDDNTPMNPSIFNLNSLSSLKSISGKLSIYKNSNLETLDGLDNLLSVGADIVNDNFTKYIVDIDYNPKLINIQALSNISTPSISIAHCTILKNINGLSGITSLKNLYLGQNDSLLNLDGLSNIFTLSSLYLVENNSLLNIDALLNITSMEDGLTFNVFNSITKELTGVLREATIYIKGNQSLGNIDGLSNLTNVIDKIKITDNSQLTDFCGLEDLIVDYNGLIGDLIATGNAYNPSKQDVLNGDCSQ